MSDDHRTSPRRDAGQPPLRNVLRLQHRFDHDPKQMELATSPSNFNTACKAFRELSGLIMPCRFSRTHAHASPRQWAPSPHRVRLMLLRLRNLHVWGHASGDRGSTANEDRRYGGGGGREERSHPTEMSLKLIGNSRGWTTTTSAWSLRSTTLPSDIPVCKSLGYPRMRIRRL